jgi:hypothetical protein
MVKPVPHEISRPRIIPENDSVHVTAVGRRIDLEIPMRAGGGRARELRRADLAVARIGVGREEVRQRGAGPLADPLQGGVRARNLPRVVARLGRVADTQLVRLGLVVAAVLEEQEAEPLLGDAAVGPESGDEDRARQDADPRDLLPRDLLSAVPGGDVPDLVAEHAGELRLGVHVGEDAAGDVDVAPRDGEGIHHRRVEDAEMPGERRQMGDLAQPLAHAVHVALHFLVRIEAVLGDHGGIGLGTHLQLFPFRDQRDLFPARHGIGGAPADRLNGEEEGGKDPDRGHSRSTRGHLVLHP